MAETDFSSRVCMLLSADSSVFSAEMIESADFKGMAEMLVKRAVPDYEDILSGDDAERQELLESCIVIQTAILLSPNVRKQQIKIEQTTHAKVEYFDTSAFDALVDNLNLRLKMLYEELNKTEYSLPPLVSLTNPNRRFHGAGFDI